MSEPETSSETMLLPSTLVTMTVCACVMLYHVLIGQCLELCGSAGCAHCPGHSHRQDWPDCGCRLLCRPVCEVSFCSTYSFLIFHRGICMPALKTLEAVLTLRSGTLLSVKCRMSMAISPTAAQWDEVASADGLHGDRWLVQNRGFNKEEPNKILDFFIFGVTIIVVAVPEGLPLAVTISLAYRYGQHPQNSAPETSVAGSLA